MKKYFYYVGVQSNNGMRFVTNVNNKNKYAIWNTEEKPLAMAQTVANDLAEALCWNGHIAVVVKSFFQLEDHFIELEVAKG